ncbi:MAG TPA: hypothetical protein VFJ82_07860 [Longimicrobium sp.]|nr:hypothetical protein [Longimicrobium sp.]
MPSLTLDAEQLVVESFPTETARPADLIVKPRTFEPGCTRDFCRAEDLP